MGWKVFFDGICNLFSSFRSFVEFGKYLFGGLQVILDISYLINIPVDFRTF